KSSTRLRGRSDSMRTSALDAREDGRVAQMIRAPPPAPGEFNLFSEAARNPESVTAKTFMNPRALSMAVVNSRGWRGAENPAANGHTHAPPLPPPHAAPPLSRATHTPP